MARVKKLIVGGEAGGEEYEHILVVPESADTLQVILAIANDDPVDALCECYEAADADEIVRLWNAKYS